MRDGFFDEKEITNSRASSPWTEAETDRLLNMYFHGTPPARIATKLGRNPKAVSRRLEQFSYNERDVAKDYRPTGRRRDRTGQKWTQNERVMLLAMVQRSVPASVAARVLARSKVEVQRKGARLEGKEQEDEGKRSKYALRIADIDVEVDLVMAYRYLYYVRGISIMSDTDYDEVERTAKDRSELAKMQLEKVGSDRAEDYPPHIRALALYLAFKYSGRIEA